MHYNFSEMEPSYGPPISEGVIGDDGDLVFQIRKCPHPSPSIRRLTPAVSVPLGKRHSALCLRAEYRSNEPVRYNPLPESAFLFSVGDGGCDMRLIYRVPEKRERLEAGLAAVLPTNRFARAYPGVTARDTMKVSTVGRSSEGALRDIAPVIREFARCDGLPARQAAADVRLRREGLRP
jgi:hypothetical protein